MPSINNQQGKVYPSPTRARYREAVIVVVKLEDHHSPYQARIRDGMILVNNNSPVTVLLPEARFGKILRVKAAAGCSQENSITLQPPSGKTVDGEEVLTLTIPYSSVILVSDETGWLIF